MPVIRLTGFGGESPCIIARLLQGNQAQAAFNVRLDDGGLTPIRKPVQHDSVDISNPKTIYKHGDTWLAWDKPVDIAEGAVAGERLYYTRDGAPKMRIGGNVYPLGLSTPTHGRNSIF